MCIKQPYYPFRCPAPFCNTLLIPPTTLIPCQRASVNNALLSTPWYRCWDPLSSTARPVNPPEWIKLQIRSECPGCEEARGFREVVKRDAEKRAMEGLRRAFSRRMKGKEGGRLRMEVRGEGKLMGLGKGKKKWEVRSREFERKRREEIRGEREMWERMKAERVGKEKKGGIKKVGKWLGLA